MAGLQAQFAGLPTGASEAHLADLRDLEEDFAGDMEDDMEGDLADDLADDIANDASNMDEDTDENGEQTEYERTVALADKLVGLHKSLKDHYAPRFPELAGLVKDPMQYAKTVGILLGHPLHDIKSLTDSSDNMTGVTLRSVLRGADLMVVTVTGSTTHGRDLSETELNNVTRITQKILEIDAERIKITQQIKSRMFETAPNLTALVGVDTAAQLLNATGGLEELIRKPAGNLSAIGANHAGETGFATNHGVRAKGYIYDSPIFENVPEDVMKQGLRIVCAKIALSARVDFAKERPDGSFGEGLHDECTNKLQKLHQAPEKKNKKALPAPDEKPSAKRGGERARKAKEATAMTDMRKAQNRVAFNQQESEVGYGVGPGTVGLGMLGQENQGNIRTTQVNKSTAAKLSKNNKGWNATASGNRNASLDDFTPGASGIASVLQARGLRDSGFGTQPDAAGTASSVTFAPAQGLSLVDPKAQAELKRKREAEENRYFNDGVFTQAPSEGSSGAGGFKVPALPNKRANTGEGAKQPPSVNHFCPFVRSFAL
ncbi:Nop domain-containing protein [Penicillium brevicompactum]|uniref:Nop domain-containing protein n=1 Tax=Penicillium brevicompactum TaxID=5074 RepID=UPI002540D8C6|nr:Nop domain-containing protein [Penicillium brevicompactum]KAJ5348664.1 Nop domain-containing protein [Penicillium brevicompactum]